MSKQTFSTPIFYQGLLKLPVLFLPPLANNHREYEQGYATNDGNGLVAAMDVDDHIDGNGTMALLLLEGAGSFFVAGRSESFVMAPGDCVVFSDCTTHGWMNKSELPSRFLSFGPILEPEYSPESLSKMLESKLASWTKPQKLKVRR